MKDNAKFLAGVLVGAAAGAVITWLLQSDEGKKILSDLKSAAGNVLQDWQRAATDGAENSADSI